MDSLRCGGGAPNGHVYVAWIDGRDDDEGALIGTSSVYLARSTEEVRASERTSQWPTESVPVAGPPWLSDPKVRST